MLKTKCSRPLAFLLFLSFISFSAVAEESKLTVNFSSSSLSLNPQYGFTTAEAQIYTALYEGLVSYHPATLQPRPGLAESWEIGEEGTVYTFHLRRDLKWSSGETLTAGHIRDSWLKLLSPGMTADYASLLDVIRGAGEYRTGTGERDAVAILAEDDRTLRVELIKPVPYFLQILCHYSFVPVHPDLLDRQDWWSETEIPVSGPFLFSGEIRRNRLILKKNDAYWDSENVDLTEIRIQFSDDPAELMDQFRLYEVDWIVSGWGGESPDPQKLVLNPLFSTSYLFFNNNQKPWDDPRVRTGLALLLPWETIRSQELIPTSRLVPTIPGYPVIRGIEAQDIKKGMSLLEEAGYPGGAGLPEIRLRVPYAEYESLNTMKAIWEELLDVSVVIEEVPFPRYFQALKDGGYALGQITWIGDYADPMTFLQMWQEGSSLNDASYYDEEYNRLLNESTSEDRLEKMAEAEQILLDTAQVLPMSHSPALNLIDLRLIDGWFANVLDIHPFKYIRFHSSFVIPGSI